MSHWTIRRVDDHRVIGTVESFSVAREIARVLTQHGIVVEVQNFTDEQEENAHE